jgi:hypothetical protein
MRNKDVLVLCPVAFFICATFFVRLNLIFWIHTKYCLSNLVLVHIDLMNSYFE